MTPPDPAIAALLQVLQTQSAVIEQQNKSLQNALAQISRLTLMVEGVTSQLDALLGDQAEERRAELRRQREEALAQASAAAEAAEAALVEIEPGKALLGSSDEASSAGDSTDSAPSAEDTEDKAKPHGGGGRGPRPDLDTDLQTLRPDTCGTCGSDELITQETRTSTEMHFVRAHVRLLKTVRELVGCKVCDAVTTPPQPPMPFERATCTFEMMAWLCFARCGLFLPLDRLRRDFEAQGARIPSATLDRWFDRAAELLTPIWVALRFALLQHATLHTDGSGLRVMFPRLKANPVGRQPRQGEVDDKGYLVHQPPLDGQIVVFGCSEVVVFYFTPTKEGHHLSDFLKLGEDADGEPLRWTGTLIADAASVHDVLFLDPDRHEGGCNAHGLRKFRDEQDKAPLLASRAMGFIGKVYKVEGRAREKGLDGAELLAYRQQHAMPVMTALHAWLTEHEEDLLPQHPVAKAMRYYLRHWHALTRFLTDPTVSPDNNFAENALRPLALFRKNSLYVGGVEGAIRLAVMMTLIGTSRLVGVDPYQYLVWALRRIVPHPTNRGYTAADLMPHQYKAELDAAK
ncbi:MAG: IS66 family transposase [bacterium]|nr:IS66 family transposase [bacterium]